LTVDVTPGKPLDKSDVEKIIGQETVAGLEYIYGPDNIAAERDRNYYYYMGIMNDLPAPAGTSSVIEPTVANYIGLLKPNLLRIFTAGRNIVEYASPKPDQKDAVRLITRYINDVVFRKDNRGELMLNDWADDALVQKLGVVMFWWEDSKEAHDEIQEGLTDAQMLLLGVAAAAGQVEILEHTAETQIADGPQGPVQTNTHSVKVRTWKNTSKCCIDCVPPEEFVVSRDARTLENAILKAHRTGVMAGDLIAQGYDPDIINGLPTWTDVYPNVDRKYGRDYTTDISRSASADPSLRKVSITRGILRCNYDGTGVKDWYVVAGGLENAPTLLEIQPYNWQVGFADFTPEPIPHSVYGRCPADRLAGLQKIQTSFIRQANNNLYLANTPQREVVAKWILKPEQLMNMSVGAPVFVEQPGAIREIAVPFVADKALLLIDHYDGQAEMTSGTSRASAGLDPQTLQNQSATAFAGQLSATQGRIEMMARIWAQGGMRKLFRGVFKCIKAYQDFARIIQIDGQPKTIDPSIWKDLDDLDVNVNTGLGTGNRDRDFALLTQIAADQKEVMGTVGPNNPIVDPSKLVRTLQLKCEAAGISYPETFFGDAKNPDGSPWFPQPAPPQPSPDTMVTAQSLIEAEKVKAMASLQKAREDRESNERIQLATIASKERVDVYKAQLDALLTGEKLGVDTAKIMVEAKRLDHDIAQDNKPDQAAA
jgi:hypothetical protein